MENELTPRINVPYPVRRNTMDDNVEKKEESLDETVGAPVDMSEKEKKEQQEKEKKAKFVAVSREQQDKARKAWEEWNKKIQEMGQQVPERHKEQVEGFIEKGIEPRHIMAGGASDGGPFAAFNAEKYKGTRLEGVANDLKESGRKEEITEEKLEEIKKRVDTMTQLGQISEDENQRFNSDINEIIVKNQQKEEPLAESGSVDAGGEGRIDDADPSSESQKARDDIAFKLSNERQLIRDLGTPGVNDNEILRNIFQQQEHILGSFDKKQFNDKQKEFLEIFSDKVPTIEEKKQKLNDFLDNVVAIRKKNYLEGKVEVPREIESIQDLARFIMQRQESDLYGLGGKYALIERIENDKGELEERFRADNFLIWVRDQIIQLHDDNRTGEMQPLSQVAIETQIRTVSIYMMNRFRGQYFKDEQTQEIMNDLADTAVNMCYLFGFFRNMDLAYQQVMNSDEDLPKTIVGIHAKNDVTHADNWATFLSMPDRFGQAKRDEKGGVIRDEKGNVVYDRDSRVGDAELVANDIYYNLSDIKELRDIAGSKGALVTRDGFRRTLLLQQMAAGKKHEWDEFPDTQEGFYDKEKDNFYVFNPDTRKKDYIFNDDGSINEKNYMTFVNFHNAPTPDKTTMDFVRDLIRLTIAEKVGIESGFAKNGAELTARKAKYEKIKSEKSPDDAEKDYKRQVNAARINAKFAEYSSFIQQRPLMISARNDVNRRGYDASTKLDINYIIRQSGSGTAGPIGNTEFLKHQILKNFGVDFVAGLKTESKRSPYEIFRDIRHVMNDSSLSQDQREDKKAALLSELRFQANAALDYSSNAIKRSYDIFHQVVGAQSLDLNKIVTRNFLEGIKYNTAEFEKQIKDEFIKPMRYAFASNSALKYGQLYRGFERLDKKTNMPIYREKTLADHMFGDEVMDDIRYDAKKNKLDIVKYDENGKKIDPSTMTEYQRYQEFLNSNDARGRIVKNIARARLAAELRKHRNRWGPTERWNADMINKFLLALQTIKEYEKDANGDIVETDKKFFSNKDIAWIRQNSGTGYKSMILKESITSTASGVGKGLFESFKDFLDNTFKS